MLETFLLIFIGSLIAFTIVSNLPANQAKSDKAQVSGVNFLQGDVWWQNSKGNIRVYFPITISIILSVVLSLVIHFLNR